MVVLCGFIYDTVIDRFINIGLDVNIAFKKKNNWTLKKKSCQKGEKEKIVWIYVELMLYYLYYDDTRRNCKPVIYVSVKRINSDTEN